MNQAMNIKVTTTKYSYNKYPTFILGGIFFHFPMLYSFNKVNVSLKNFFPNKIFPEWVFCREIFCVNMCELLARVQTLLISFWRVFARRLENCCWVSIFAGFPSKRLHNAALRNWRVGDIFMVSSCCKYYSRGQNFKTNVFANKFSLRNDTEPWFCLFYSHGICLGQLSM